jgi:hypothetical protein
MTCLEFVYLYPFILGPEFPFRLARFLKCQDEWDGQMNQSTGFVLIFQEELKQRPFTVLSDIYSGSGQCILITHFIKGSTLITASQVTHKCQLLPIPRAA